MKNNNPIKTTPVTTMTTINTTTNSATLQSSASTAVKSNVRKTNVRGGKKFKRAKKNIFTENTRELYTKYIDEGMEYGRVLKNLGSGRYEIYCYDGETRTGLMRGQIKKFTRLNFGDIVLVSLRLFSKEMKCDILHKYNLDEVRKLQELEELPYILASEDDLNIQNNDIVVFYEEKNEQPVKEKATYAREMPSDDDDDEDDDEDESGEDEELDTDNFEAKAEAKESNNDVLEAHGNNESPDSKEETEESDNEETEPSSLNRFNQGWMIKEATQKDKRMKGIGQREEYNIDDI